MSNSDTFLVKPGNTIRLSDRDPADTGPHASHKAAKSDIESLRKRMEDMQCLLYADGEKSLLIVLQGLDAAGKDSDPAYFQRHEPPGRVSRQFQTAHATRSGA